MSSPNMSTLGRAATAKRQNSQKRPSTSTAGSSFSTHFHGHVPRRSRAHSLTGATNGTDNSANAVTETQSAAVGPANDVFPYTDEDAKEVVFIVREDLRHRQFVYRHGSKHHCFPRSEAPWPFSYDREVLEQSLIDAPLLNNLRDSSSFVEYYGKQPKKCLDLGTGMGGWVVDAAQAFPHCSFVGFDLTDIQVNLKYVTPSVAKRITWVHGNFLNFPLPFADNEFDYVHLVGVALGVPENKWTPLFEEINRILCPGGVVEMLQQDARFPVLPRWFTDPIHEHLWHRQEAQAKSAEPSHITYIPTREISQSVPHAYSLLEELYNSVFESRFVNRTPSAILPNYFLSVFTKVISPPTLRVSVPPVAPPIPRGFQVDLNDTSSINGITSDPLDPTTYFIPNSEEYSVVIDPPSYSAASSETLLALEDKMFPEFVLKELSICEEPKSTTSPLDDSPLVRLSESKHAHTRSATQPLERLHTTSPILDRSPSLYSQRTRTISSVSTSSPRRERPAAQLALQDATQLGGEVAKTLFRVDRMQEMGEGALFMHLYQASQMVYAVKEAMWEELVARVDKKDPKLAVYGWKSGEDYILKESRRKFEGLFVSYKHDMGVRLSFWHSLLRCGWKLPTQRPLSALEREEEDKLRRAILEARKQATEEEFNTPIRSFRLLMGVKRS